MAFTADISPTRDVRLAVREHVGKLAAQFEKHSDPRLALRLFADLGWDGADFSLVPSDSTAPNLHRLTAAGEIAGLLLVAAPRSIQGSYDQLASLAYNSGVDWLTVSDFATTKVFHVRWQDDPSIFELAWQDYLTRLDDLALLSPEGLTTGGLAQKAEEVRGKRRELPPVDDDLMRNLEAWRRLLLQTSPGVTDGDVHEMLGRLLFIRSAEDRGIVQRDSLLLLQRTAAGRTSDDLAATLDVYFRDLGQRFNSELFLDTASTTAFDAGALAEVIRRLYEPFPGLQRYRYDFSHIDVDVLGKVYERYVSNVLVSAPPSSPQLRLLEEPAAQLVPVSKRRAEGIYYTPSFISEYIVHHTIDLMSSEADTSADLPRVADISCGSGSFLIAAAKSLVSRGVQLGADPAVAAEVCAERLLGVDRDPRAVSLARVNLWTLVNTYAPATPLPRLGEAIWTDDALLSPRLDTFRGRLDAVIGNPPFRSASALDHDTFRSLARRYRSAHGRFDLSYLFAERAVELVRPGGVIGLVLPNRMFTNVDAQALRDFLVEHCDILSIVDFGHTRPFPDASAYVSIVIARRREQARIAGVGEGAATATLHRLVHLSNFPSVQLRRADDHAGERWEDAWSQVTPAAQPTTGGPWIWGSTDIAERISQKLAAVGQPLDNVANVHQGIRTGDNDVFIARRLRVEPDGLWRVSTRAGTSVVIEPELLRPCIRSELIDPYSLRQEAAEFVLYPYDEAGLLSLENLRARYPSAYAYLDGLQERLSRRATVRRGGAWWDLSWARFGAGLSGPKLLGRQLTKVAAFALDSTGTTAPVAATFIVQRDSDFPLKLILALLNSSLATWQLRQSGAVFRGGFIEITQSRLRRLVGPWELLLRHPLVARRLAQLAESAMRTAQLGLSVLEHTAEIDELLFDLIGLEAEERLTIQKLARDQSGVAQESSALPFREDEDPLRALERARDILQGATPLDGARLARQLVEVRDLVRWALRAKGAEWPPAARSALTMAGLAADRIGRDRDDHGCLPLLISVIEDAMVRPVDMISAFAFDEQLAARGVHVMPSLRGASIRLGPDPAADAET